MSGSPIVRKGRPVVAVAHVPVDPTRGYGIFAENMLSIAGAVAQQDSAA